MSSFISRRSFLSSTAKLGMLSRLGVAPMTFASGAAPIQRTVSRTVSFDDGWLFHKGDAPGAEQTAFQDQSWRALSVPHDWSIEGTVDRNEPSAGTGAYLPTGIGWYRKHFALPRDAARKRVVLRFDGVYQRSEVWINGHPLGMRPYGYSTFSYDLTPYLQYGKRANTVAVRVDNSLQPNSRWYSGSGIYRHTWLRVTEPVHIAEFGVCVRATDVTAQAATVSIETRLVNSSAAACACTVRASVHDSQGKALPVEPVQAQLAANSEQVIRQMLQVEQPALWSPASPHLYTVRTVLSTDASSSADSGAGELDQETTPFGIRDVRFDRDRGFLLNGAPVKLNGVCLHGDAGAVGTAVPESMWERRLQLLQAMGCNAVRTSHNPPAPEFLDLCDAMGMLVMDEAFDEWRQPKGGTKDYGYHKYFDAWSVRDLTDMVRRDRNHPSIVIWSAGNEIPDQRDPRGPETLQALLDILHREDPTRLVTAGCDNIASDPPPSALPAFLAKLDVVGYNYVDRWRDRRERFYSIDRHDYPERRFIGTESAAFRSPRGAYTLEEEDSQFYERTSNTRIAIEQLQKFIHTYDYVSGDFIWTGIDYLGEARWPAKGRDCGALDTCGFPKDSYYFYQSQWTQTPMVYLASHWNWPGKAAQPITVLCYTNCETVELFLNGKSLGVKGYAFPRPGMTERYGHYPPRAKVLQTTGDLHLAWDVLYEPGVLQAVGTSGGKVVARYQVQTTGMPAALRLSADKDAIEPGFRHVAHVKVEVIDSQGLVVPDADASITFTLAGAGTILGIDNGRPDSHESYREHQRAVFNGLALVLLQAESTAIAGRGAMTLSAASPGLEPASLTVRVGVRAGVAS